MKYKILILPALIFFVLTGVNGQGNLNNNNKIGIWKFEAPSAPEGYTSGTITIGFADKIYSASMSFSGSDYVLAGEKVKVLKDSVLFSVYIEGDDIRVMLKTEKKEQMFGKAVYSQGEVPLTLTKSSSSTGSSR